MTFGLIRVVQLTDEIDFGHPFAFVWNGQANYTRMKNVIAVRGMTNNDDLWQNVQLTFCTTS
eukprot:SAG31_NODE_5446_length_2533_cov_1.336072_1_plen_62_part_00